MQQTPYVSIATATMFVNMDSRIIDNAINARPVVVNALTGTLLAHVNVTSVLDQYLECMITSMPLRAAARACGISLDTAFHLQYVNAP